jgi:hypothetical protein
LPATPVTADGHGLRFPVFSRNRHDNHPSITYASTPAVATETEKETAAATRVKLRPDLIPDSESPMAEARRNEHRISATPSFTTSGPRVHQSCDMMSHAGSHSTYETQASTPL